MGYAPHKFLKQMTKIKGALSREIVAQPAEKIAKAAGIALPKGKSLHGLPPNPQHPAFRA
jgi:hypothetical protein